MFVIYLKYDDFAEQKRPHFSYFSPPIDTQLRGKGPGAVFKSLYRLDFIYSVLSP